MCLSLLLSWEAAVTDPCPGPEEHPSSFLLSCKLSAVTPLILLQLHLYTHSSRQVLHLVCASMELSALLPKIQFPRASMPSIYYIWQVWWDSSLQQQLGMLKISKIYFPASFLSLMTDWHGLQIPLPLLSEIISLHHISSLTGFKTLSLWASSHIQTLLIIMFNKIPINSLSKIFSILHMQSHSVKIQFWDFQPVVHRIPSKAIW